MLPAKNATRLCESCGREFYPPFPDTGVSDEKCQFCIANEEAPDWFGEEGQRDQQP